MAQHVLIVGAGIIGATTAYELQRGGAQVTLIDASHPSATQTSFGWINASFFHNADHHRLRSESIAAYQKLSADLMLPINWCGCLCFENEEDAFDRQRDELQTLGYAFDEIDAVTFARLEPHVANPPKWSLRFRQEAAAESGDLAKRLLDEAVAAGAKVITGVAVDGFETKAGRVCGVHTPVGTFSADTVVVATGTATEKVMTQADVSIPMLTRPALMLRTQPVQPILNHILVSEFGEVRQLADGALMMPAAVSHQSDSADTLDSTPDKEADQALTRLKALLPDIPLDWSHITVAHRPVPQDELPVVGFVRHGLYVATMHSGITLGALMGRLIATEVLYGLTNDTARMLAPYRPDRFAHQA